MFISRKRWNEMERRVAELEKRSAPDAATMTQVKSEIKAAFERAASFVGFRPIDSGGFRDSHESSSTYFAANNHK